MSLQVGPYLSTLGRQRIEKKEDLDIQMTAPLSSIGCKIDSIRVILFHFYDREHHYSAASLHPSQLNPHQNRSIQTNNILSPSSSSQDGVAVQGSDRSHFPRDFPFMSQSNNER